MSSGWLMGKMFSESSLGMPALVALSGGLCWIGGSVAGKGILLFAPKLAKQFLDNASGITMASLIGGIMGAVGYGVGYSAGLSLDLLCLAFQNACSYIVNIGSDNSPYEKLTGFTCDGKRILNGVEVQLIQKESAPSDMQPFTVEYTPHENGFLVKVGHDEVFIPKDFNQFAHKDFITKLLEKTAPQLAAPEPGLFDVEEDYETPIRAPEYHEDLFSQDTANTPLMGQPVPPPQTEQALVYEDVSFTEEEMALTEEDIPDHIRNLPKPYYLWALKEFLRSQSF